MTNERVEADGAVVVTMLARICGGLGLPTEPVLKPAGLKGAAVPAGGPVTMNSARPAGDRTMSVTLGSPVTGNPSSGNTSSDSTGGPEQTTKPRKSLNESNSDRP